VIRNSFFLILAFVPYHPGCYPYSQMERNLSILVLMFVAPCFLHGEEKVDLSIRPPDPN